MSFLRYSRPGIPGTTLIDQGPASGRVHHGKGTRGSIGGALVTAQKARPLPIPATNEARRVQMAEYRSHRRDGRCGMVMRTRGVCARMAGHGNQCRTREQLAARVAKRGKAFSIHPENRR